MTCPKISKYNCEQYLTTTVSSTFYITENIESISQKMDVTSKFKKKKKQAKEWLKNKGPSKSGTKQELVNRIKNHNIYPKISSNMKE